MTSNYANSSLASTDPRHVLFVVYPDIVLLDLVGPLQVFTHARPNPASDPAYSTHVASYTGGATETNTILQIDTDPLSQWLDLHRDMPIHTLVLIGGDGAIPAAKDRCFLDQVRMLANRSVRICSVCSGAVVLAAAGILDGRRAVTHWEDCEYLAAEFPLVNVEVDPIYVKDGNVWTSAGITAGIDMALAIIEEDLGKSAAIAMARSLVTPMVRSGGQSQFSAELDQQARDTQGRFAPLHNWLAQNIASRITVAEMADVCGMSPRNFSRKYMQTLGISPAKAVEAARINKARDMLAGTAKSIKEIAVNCGFQDDERMRRAFLRTVSTSPSEYRKLFRL